MGNMDKQLSDRKWSERFRQKVMEDYERQQEENAKKLAEAELSRLHKLRLQGFLPDDDERWNTRSKRSKWKSKDRHRDILKQWRAKHLNLYRPDTDIETQLQDLHREEKQNANSIEHTDMETSRDGEHMNKENGAVGNNDETGNYRGDKDESDHDIKWQLGRTIGNSLPANVNLERLYDEEDLQMLYQEAEVLVRVGAKK